MPNAMKLTAPRNYGVYIGEVLSPSMVSPGAFSRTSAFFNFMSIIFRLVGEGPRFLFDVGLCE
jgi:hypothetical protein